MVNITGKIYKSNIEYQLPESNTKTFYLSSESDLTTAQAAYDWYLAGKNPIIVYKRAGYMLWDNGGGRIRFTTNKHGKTQTTVGDVFASTCINIFYDSNNTVTSITSVGVANGPTFLSTTYNSSYTPTQPGNPATKRYVDSKVTASATAPSSPTEGMLWYDTTNDQLKAYDGTNWNATGKEYHAGEGISIGDVSINGRQGPSPDGFHVPSTTEWQGLNTIMTSLSLTTGDGWRINLHMPFAGYRSYSNTSLRSQGSGGYYWLSSNARLVYLDSSYVLTNNNSLLASGNSVRCFKDSYVAPDSTWTVVQGTLGSAGIFWNQSEGLISITDGSTGYTMMDKNLGATTVYSDGDTLTEANMGYMYQWGNNYGFPSTGTITNTSSTQVDASNYGPNTANGYYESDTFITRNQDWSSVHNDDLWGDTTGAFTQENVISNTGVLSVNGQTGDVETNVFLTQEDYDDIVSPVNGVTYFIYEEEE